MNPLQTPASVPVSDGAGPAPVASFDCPGRTMPQPKGAPWEGYVACYRAGHHCPSKVAFTTEDATHLTTTWRCPCCGDHGGTYCRPKEWDEQAPELASMQPPEIVLDPS